MSFPAKDGAWVSAADVTVITCSICGQVETGHRRHLSERETNDLIRAHIAAEHGGGYVT